MSLRLLHTINSIKSPDTHCPLCQQTYTRRGKTEEHIFPKWFQQHHGIRDKLLNVPNQTRSQYRSVRIPACELCNNRRFGELESYLAPYFKADDLFTALLDVDDHLLAVWLGKIMWLMTMRSGHAIDYRTRDLPKKDTVLPGEFLPGASYLGAFIRTFALRKQMDARMQGEPDYPPLYRAPYSFYRFKLDNQGQDIEPFHFFDDFTVLGAAMISDNIGMICLFDHGLHRYWCSEIYSEYTNRVLHPVQFQELAAKILFDQTALHPVAHHHVYHWREAESRLLTTNGAHCNECPYEASRVSYEYLAEWLHRFTDGRITRKVVNGETLFDTMLKDNQGRHWDCVNNRPWADPPVWFHPSRFI